jgi:hypothetical protein
MKLRIHGNSVRLRLNRTDLRLFAANGRIDDWVQFPGARLSYTLECSPSVKDIRTRYEGPTIRILVPPEMAWKWANSDQVGIGCDGPIGPSVLIEKDFQCLHREDAQENDDFDCFPNPLENLSIAS